MLNKVAATCVTVATICAATVAGAQEAETWNGPFGGTFTAGIAVTNDYSYRGISQTQRQWAVQPTFIYETATVAESVPISAYGGFWASNVSFTGGTNVYAEVDILAGLRAKALDGKLTGDLGYIRYSYLGSDAAPLFMDFNEFGLVVGYDFGVVALSGAVRYSPNFFGDSGRAWYKWAQATVPLPFIDFNENISFKVFGTLASQYVEKNANYGIPNNDYWDWSLGLTVTVYGFDLSIAYVDTNIDVPGCLNTYNCEARAIFTVSKTF
ncbi:MAG: TorF family putative porin [Enhydrobacter sp.]|nr:MAG: TorF family putative porin [Enhydrobacter sp.]